MKIEFPGYSLEKLQGRYPWVAVPCWKGYVEHSLRHDIFLPPTTASPITIQLVKEAWAGSPEEERALVLAKNDGLPTTHYIGVLHYDVRKYPNADESVEVIYNCTNWALRGVEYGIWKCKEGRLEQGKICASIGHVFERRKLEVTWPNAAVDEELRDFLANYRELFSDLPKKVKKHLPLK